MAAETLFSLLLLCVLPVEEVEPRMVHLRSGDIREWSVFPAEAEAAALERHFAAAANPDEWTLFLRQEDVKQIWRVTLNGKPLGELTRDENPMDTAFAIPAGILSDDNTLRIATSGMSPSDDIRVGRIRLQRGRRTAALSEATLSVTVLDNGQPVPCRITVVNESGALTPLGTSSNRQLAVRQGVCYTATGAATLTLPAGPYTIYAGRGVEYSVAEAKIDVAAGMAAKIALTIRREVPTNGYVACDTHIHTLTHSGHGDATMEERLIAIAGEGIELPIATDHNKQIDYAPLARSMGLTQWFTPVVGNEVTTPRGHFNIFPVAAGENGPNHRLPDWPKLFGEIERETMAPFVVLNHARDIHSGFRPFGAEWFNGATGEHALPWPIQLTAMEVINSGATQTDPLRLTHDWMALLNRGRQITPIGSSDSHDVARHFVGQGRTYIRCGDRDPGNIDVQDAVASLREGRVMVSYGLLADLTVEEQYGPGDLAVTREREWQIRVRVLGPHWVRARRLMLFANGRLVREAAVSPPANGGVQAEERWSLPKSGHDIHLVAVALGDGVNALYWPTAKAYQPTSPDWQSHTLGVSGAVWLDGDDDGRRTSARVYAEQVVQTAQQNLAASLKLLADYDSSTAAQAAGILEQLGVNLTTAANQAQISAATASVRAGFEAYLAARPSLDQ